MLMHQSNNEKISSIQMQEYVNQTFKKYFITTKLFQNTFKLAKMMDIFTLL